jgi:hypothetical protein
MSMSTYVYGVRDLDGMFAKMMRVKKVCDTAGISYPKEVTEYFKDPGENEETIRREMETLEIKFERNSRNGEYIYEVQLEDLPKEVKAIRFINSW